MSQHPRHAARLSAILPIVVLALGVVAMGSASVELVFPPFTDAQLSANFVDTWEAHTLGNFVLLLLFFVGFVASGIAAWFATASNRLFFGLAAAAFLLAAALDVVAMHTLTARTESLTGQSLSWL